MTASVTERPWLERAEVTIFVGDVYASARPALVKTLVGSCIAVCFWDGKARVGGMNHFMLPNALANPDEDSARFGVHAMDLLICEMMKAGAERSRIVAKVFGGAHVLEIEEAEHSVPRQNIRFIRGFLERDGFRIVEEDVGGQLPRQVRFETDSGQAVVKGVTSTRMMAELMKKERVEAEQKPLYGEVTLF